MLARTFDKEPKDVLHLIGYKSSFRTEAAIVQPELQLVCANGCGKRCPSR